MLLMQSATSEALGIRVSNTPKTKLEMDDESGSDSNYDTDSDSDSDFSITELFTKISEIDEDLILLQNGYKRIRKICNTSQGELIEAEAVDVKVQNQIVQRVAIKKISKEHHKQRISEQDGVTYCVQKNVIKEAQILEHLTVHNQCISDNIVHFVEFFESDDHFYLVMEYVDSDINLKQFIVRSHEYMKSGKLKKKYCT